MAKVSLQMVEKEVQAATDLFKDGFQVSDIFKAVTHFMEIAEVMEGTTGAERKEFVVAAFKKLYAKKNPDLSKWVPQWLEKKVVTYAIDSVLPYAIDWIVDATKGKLQLNKD